MRNIKKWLKRYVFDSSLLYHLLRHFIIRFGKWSIQIHLRSRKTHVAHRDSRTFVRLKSRYIEVTCLMPFEGKSEERTLFSMWCPASPSPLAILHVLDDGDGETSRRASLLLRCWGQSTWLTRYCLVRDRRYRRGHRRKPPPPLTAINSPPEQ